MNADDGLHHVYPLDDYKEHVTEGKDCWCRPAIIDGVIIIHNSLDRRELYENTTH